MNQLANYTNSISEGQVSQAWRDYQPAREVGALQ
uniref:Uncharacterized protein n=1 Tax=Anguilla anguilla TaxID=7936 RepID=A0A0E9S1H9_ANGAN